MSHIHDYLATTPFDLYELSLFHLVVKQRSFTRAAELAGLTQSAITRQMQGMESSLGLDLLERTTRSVRVTPAGEHLYQASRQILGDVDAVLQRLREDYGKARKQVRVGVSRTIALAYLPGFFHANLRRQPQVGCRVSSHSSDQILEDLQAHELDLGVLAAPARLPRTLRVTHRFDDAFTLIVPASGPGAALGPRSLRDFQKWVAAQTWLLIRENTNTGRQLRQWLAKNRWEIEPAMELDSFDWIINLVALSLGVSFVPIRALALYPQKRNLRRINLGKRFTREIIVAVRGHRRLPEHLSQFVENILF